MRLTDLHRAAPSKVVVEETSSRDHATEPASLTSILDKLVHDIRNPLGAIAVTNRLLSMGVSDEKLFKAIVTQESAIKQIKEILKTTLEKHGAKDGAWLNSDTGTFKKLG